MRKITSFLQSAKKYAFAHKKISIAVLVVFLVVGFIFRPKAPAPIDTQVVGKHDVIQTVSVSGSVDALNKVDLSFVSTGQLVYLGAKKNSNVTAGQLIAQEDSRTVEKNLETALITASEQRNTYDQTVYNNRDKALDDSMKRILQNNQYDLDKSINSVELRDLARQQAMLVSPINGIVTRADAVAVGTTALPTTIFEVVDPTSLVFSMEVDEGDVGKVRLGQQVSISLDAYPNTTLHLPVDSIDYASHATANGGTAYYVKAKLPGEDLDRYRLGLNGNADILTAEKKQVLSIPLSALFDDTYVYVKKGKGFVKRKLVLGLQNDTNAEVLSGLSAGEIIAIQPSKVPQNIVLPK